MIDKQVVESKLGEIDQYLFEAQPILELTEQEILDDVRNLRTLERNFQLIVDAILAINSHLIAGLLLTPAEDYQGTFTILSQHKVLPIEFTQKIAPVVGLRNQIVHAYDERSESKEQSDYEKVDRKKFVRDLKKNHHQFRQYIRLTNQLIKKVRK
jgi:uncharacterized protein YutE (UPF0331/DUF86 family)